MVSIPKTSLNAGVAKIKDIATALKKKKKVESSKRSQTRMQLFFYNLHSNMKASL